MQKDFVRTSRISKLYNFQYRNSASFFRFDAKYKINGTVNPNTKEHEFNGEYGWQLKWSDSDLGFRLQNPNFENVVGK